jgi:hypothetical protein
MNRGIDDATTRVLLPLALHRFFLFEIVFMQFKKETNNEIVDYSAIFRERAAVA